MFLWTCSDGHVSSVNSAPRSASSVFPFCLGFHLSLATETHTRDMRPFHSPPHPPLGWPHPLSPNSPLPAFLLTRGAVDNGVSFHLRPLQPWWKALGTAAQELQKSRASAALYFEHLLALKYVLTAVIGIMEG